MTPGARIAAAIDILDQIKGGVAAEKALTAWARSSRFAGSGDRAAVRDHVFDVLRRRRSLGDGTGRGLMVALAAAEGWDIPALFSGQGHAPDPVTAAEHIAYQTEIPVSEAAAHDLPDWLWPMWQDSLGTGASRAAKVLQTRADVFLRVNQRRGTREDAQKVLATEGIVTERTALVPTTLRVTQNARRVKQSKAYLTGLLEIQDAASQWAVQQLVDYAGTRVLDYCAGGGGKALGLADLTRAQIFAHDIAPARMVDLPARAARAGVKITTLATDDLADAGPFDLVFCDAPCSGSGTWRRTPDAKWRLTQQDLDRLIQTQSQVLRDAAPLVAPGGILAYATCSVLSGENSDRIDAFRKDHPKWRTILENRLIPHEDHDGFYLCALRRM